MTYSEYVEYHLRGDAGVEERMIASLGRKLGLSDWDQFRLVYYYSMTYHIPSALKLLLEKDVRKSDMSFRTDRRWVGYVDRYERLLAELRPEMLTVLKGCRSTQKAYDTVRGWFYFSRYTTCLLLEVYMNAFKPQWTDNVRFMWEPKENYTKGAVHLAGTADKSVLDQLLNRMRADLKDNAFAIETSLCAVEKINKGTRWDGYYTERMLKEADESRYRELIYSCL
ncbi:MAG: hypothetical protein LUI09_03695 [Prevotellaceae bacterium]|nr:hypothetical protein [Prevotellaceae bacterium]